MALFCAFCLAFWQRVNLAYSRESGRSQSIKEEVLRTVLRWKACWIIAHLEVDLKRLGAIRFKPHGRTKPTHPSGRGWSQGDVLSEALATNTCVSKPAVVTCVERMRPDADNSKEMTTVVCSSWLDARQSFRVFPKPDDPFRTGRVQTKSNTYTRPVSPMCRLEALTNAPDSRTDCVIKKMSSDRSNAVNLGTKAWPITIHQSRVSSFNSSPSSSKLIGQCFRNNFVA